MLVRCGSIASLINADGSPSWINTYDEYGMPGDNHGRFQYTGQTWIPELRVYYYKARFYSPGLGRFLQVDPIGYEGGINLYAYVDNDPINNEDPTGNCRVCLKLGVDFALEAALQYVTTGHINLGEATRNTAMGFVNPLRTAKKARDLSQAVRAVSAARARTHQTYTKVNSRSSQTYSGRASGHGTPAQNVARRDQNHHMTAQGYGPARLDRSSSSPEAIRGREQQLIERHGGAASEGGTSGNAINGISRRNEKGPDCRAAATREFGPC